MNDGLFARFWLQRICTAYIYTIIRMFDTNYINLSVKKDLNELVLGQFSL